MRNNNKLSLATKSTFTKPLALSLGLAVAGISSHSAQAATIAKANNTDDLNLTTSWTTGVVPGAADTALWDGTVTGPNSVSLGADLSWQGVAITSPGGPVTIGGSNTLTTGTAGIDLSAATQDLTISSNLTLLGNTGQTWNVASGRTLTLNGSTFTRNVGATLNIQNAGTIATTNIANTATGSNGIIGAWATIGSGTSLSYATVSSGTIISFAGAIPYATGSNTPTSNYDVTGNVTLTGNKNANTLRNTGANTVTVGSSKSLYLGAGLLNAGTGTFTIASSGNGVINPQSTELVISTNTQNIAVNAPIDDKNFNSAGAANSVTVTISSQGGTVILTPTGTGSGVANGSTYSGGTVLNSGTISLGQNAALGTGVLTMAAGTTLTATAARTIANNVALNGAATFTPFSGTIFTVNGIISGSGSLTKTGTNTDTLTLTAANTFTGATNVTGGTLLLSTGSVASTVASVSGMGALTLNNATALADTLTLSLVNGTTLNLNAAGGSETIGALLLDGNSVANGTYTVAQLSGFDPNITFSSLSGETLTVGAAVPEPSTLVASLLLVGSVGYQKRRRVQFLLRRAF